MWVFGCPNLSKLATFKLPNLPQKKKFEMLGNFASHPGLIGPAPFN